MSKRRCAQCYVLELDHNDDALPQHEFVPIGEHIALLTEMHMAMRADVIPAKHRSWFMRLHTLLGEICKVCGNYRASHVLNSNHEFESVIGEVEE
jgi:hypothetical protein